MWEFLAMPYCTGLNQTVATGTLLFGFTAMTFAGCIFGYVIGRPKE